MVAANKTKSQKTIPYLHEPPLVGSLPAFMKQRMSFLLQVSQANDVWFSSRTCAYCYV